MAQKDIATLRAQAQVIRDETVDGANTVARVGGMHEDQNDSAINAVETAAQSIASNVDFPKVGIGVSTFLNLLDVAGGMAVGSSYAGLITAPTDGMIVEGNFGLGRSNPTVKFDVDTPDTTMFRLRRSGNIKCTILADASNGQIRLNNSAGSNAIRLNTGGDSYIDGALNFSVGKTTPLAKIDSDQSDATAAIPALKLRQADLSEEMINFDATVAVGNPIEAVAAKTLTPTHFIKVNIEGVGERYIQAGTIA